ncbi:MAG: tellurite resistance/C4-dicarboxylate transporter family protein, partial [Nakamurella sp.]
MATSAMERAQSSVAGLAPGYFALVMANGIISVGMKLKGLELISTILLIVCIVGFVILLCLMVWRFVAYRGAMNSDLRDPGRAFGFFTIVAGTNVLGVRLGMEGAHAATALLLGLAGTAWLLLGYVVPWATV